MLDATHTHTVRHVCVARMRALLWRLFAAAVPSAVALGALGSLARLCFILPPITDVFQARDEKFFSSYNLIHTGAKYKLSPAARRDEE
jgi:hypothetical protein